MKSILKVKICLSGCLRYNKNYYSEDRRAIFMTAILMLGVGIFAFLMTWNRFSIFLLKKRVSALENKLGIKTDAYGDECEQNGP